MGARTGAVAIGRNEGERLDKCLRSLVGAVGAVVYVDSGSTDGSVQLARSLGVTVVDLDTTIPFTAARARNAGFARLLEVAPDLEFVQFVDGDCEVAPGWIDAAERAIAADPQIAVVCGRRRERHPEASVYNRLCDLEWDQPPGPTDACGGDALMRVAALRAVDGYDPSLIAGEEPELCLRLRRRGWTILRIAVEMTRHDAAMTRFSQWWKRNVRAGHAFAEVSTRHAGDPEHYWAKPTRSNWMWGAALPAASVALAAPSLGLSLNLLWLYGALGVRVYQSDRRRGFSPPDARADALFCVMSKVPQAIGQATYWRRRLTGGEGRLIEYKGPST